MPSHSLFRWLSLLLIIHYSVAVPADPNYLGLNPDGDTAFLSSLSSSVDRSTGDMVDPSLDGPVDATSDSQWQQGSALLNSDDLESSGSVIASKKNGCQASAGQDPLSKRDQNFCSANPATLTPTGQQEAGQQESSQQPGNAQTPSSASEKQRRPLPKPQPLDLPEDDRICKIPWMNVPVCAPESFAIGEPIKNLIACNLPLWTLNGPQCDYFLQAEKLWCCGYASLKIRNRKPQGPRPGASPPDQSLPLMVPSFDKLNELIQDLDKAAPPTLDDTVYPYEALSCVKYEEQDRFVGMRPF